MAGMFGTRVEDPADLKKAMTEAFQYKNEIKAKEL
jgi:hypothetical protein